MTNEHCKMFLSGKDYGTIEKITRMEIEFQEVQV
jgi:hypothetical protein